MSDNNEYFLTGSASAILDAFPEDREGNYEYYIEDTDNDGHLNYVFKINDPQSAKDDLANVNDFGEGMQDFGSSVADFGNIVRLSSATLVAPPTTKFALAAFGIGSKINGAGKVIDWSGRGVSFTSDYLSDSIGEQEKEIEFDVEPSETVQDLKEFVEDVGETIGRTVQTVERAKKKVNQIRDYFDGDVTPRLQDAFNRLESLI